LEHLKRRNNLPVSFIPNKKQSLDHLHKDSTMYSLIHSSGEQHKMEGRDDTKNLELRRLRTTDGAKFDWPVIRVTRLGAFSPFGHFLKALV